MAKVVNLTLTSLLCDMDGLDCRPWVRTPGIFCGYWYEGGKEKVKLFSHLVGKSYWIGWRVIQTEAWKLDEVATLAYTENKVVVKILTVMPQKWNCWPRCTTLDRWETCPSAIRLCVGLTSQAFSKWCWIHTAVLGWRAVVWKEQSHLGTADGGGACSDARVW